MSYDDAMNYNVDAKVLLEKKEKKSKEHWEKFIREIEERRKQRWR